MSRAESAGASTAIPRLGEPGTTYGCPKYGASTRGPRTTIYAYAALRALISMGLSLDNEADRIAALRNEQQQPLVTPPHQRRWLGDRTREWLKR